MENIKKFTEQGATNAFLVSCALSLTNGNTTFTESVVFTDGEFFNKKKFVEEVLEIDKFPEVTNVTVIGVVSLTLKQASIYLSNE